MGAIPAVMPYWLAPKIAGFQSQYPEVEVHLVENITARLIEGLQTGDLDVAVLQLASGFFPDVVCMKLFREGNSCLCFPTRIRLPLYHALILGAHRGQTFCSCCARVTASRKDALAVCRRSVREPGTLARAIGFLACLRWLPADLESPSRLRWRSRSEWMPSAFPVTGGPSRRISYAQIRRPYVPPAQKSVYRLAERAPPSSLGG